MSIIYDGESERQTTKHVGILDNYLIIFEKGQLINGNAGKALDLSFFYCKKEKNKDEGKIFLYLSRK